MKTEIHYSGDRTDKLVAAFEDCKSYLGEDKLELLTDYLQKLYKSKGIGFMIKTAPLVCSFAGIEGFPVKAIIRYSVHKV